MTDKSFYNRPRDTGNDSPISARRLALGMTQAQLSEKSGISIKQISRLESKASSPNLKSLAKLSKALNCTIDELINP